MAFADENHQSGTNYIRIYNASGVVLLSSTIHTLERVVNCDINDSGFLIVGSQAANSGNHVAEVYDVSGNVVFSHSQSGSTDSVGYVSASKSSNFIFGVTVSALPG